jgi:hypothetical protein
MYSAVVDCEDLRGVLEGTFQNLVETGPTGFYAFLSPMLRLPGATRKYPLFWLSNRFPHRELLQAHRQWFSSA